MVRNKKGRITAWLITLEDCDSNNTKKVLGIISSREKRNFVLKYCELLYSGIAYNDREKLLYRKNKPYKAMFDDIDGIQRMQRITCGHNPYIEARIVHNLFYDENINSLSWEEPKKTSSIISFM